MALYWDDGDSGDESADKPVQVINILLLLILTTKASIANGKVPNVDISNKGFSCKTVT